MLTEELERLGRLRSEGILSEEEFLKAKALLLSELPTSKGLSLLNWQAELERIDREWEQRREKYLSTRKYGQRVLPTTKPMSLFTTSTGIVGISFLVSMGILQTTEDVYFIAFGVIMTAILVVCGIVENIHRDNYEKAKARYEKQRTEHLQRKPS